MHVDAALEAGAPEAEVNTAREAATLLLGLPWELLHDSNAFLFQGARPVRVRRRLPNTRVLDVPVVATPIRILLVTARPEDEACAYIDHRASALPLVEAMEALGDSVRLHILNPPTLAALGEELQRAALAKKPYQVVHFDGHGVYDRRAGLGGLCFEDPQDEARLDQRRHATVSVARPPGAAGLLGGLPDGDVGAGQRIGGHHAAERGRGLGGGDEPQRAGGDRAPLCRGLLPNPGPG